jgi:ribosomal protein S3
VGQKVHPEILKVSRTEGWKSRYYEKKATSLNSQTHKNEEITKFIRQFFKRIGLSLHTCKLNYLNNKINISASYIKSNGLVDGVSKYSRKVTRKRSKTPKVSKYSRKVTRKRSKKPKVYSLFKKHKKVYKPLLKKSKKSDTVKLNFYLVSLIYCSLLALKLKNQYSHVFHGKLLNQNYIKDISEKNFAAPFKIFTLFLKKTLKFLMCLFSLISTKSHKKSCKYTFLSLFFKIFTICYQKNLKITLIFKILNRHFKKSKPTLKKKTLRKKVLTSLRRYNRNKFFKKAINLMFLMASQKESAKLLSSFVAHSIKNFKKHKWFLKFIKKGLSALVKRKKPIIKALTIQLKGRINGVDRARSYIINSRKRVPLIQIGSRINYAETTAFTPDGTLSVKVWVEYHKLNYAKRTTKNKIKKTQPPLKFQNIREKHRTKNQKKPKVYNLFKKHKKVYKPLLKKVKNPTQ